MREGRLTPGVLLHHQRKAKPVPDEAIRCLHLPVSGWRASGTALPVGCGHHPAMIGPRACRATHFHFP